VCGVSGLAASGTTYFLEDDFDGTDGVNCTSHTADTPASTWSGDDQDNLELDTAVKDAGTASLKVNGSDNYKCYMDYGAGYSSGKITCELEIYFVDDFSTHGEFAFSKGAYVWGNNNWTNLFRQNSATIEAYTGGGWSNQGAVTKGQFNHIEIELDLDNNRFDMWVDDGQVSDDVAFQNSGAGVEPLDVFNIMDNTGSADMWYDTISCYEGARQ
jgi:hypothetical protein